MVCAMCAAASPFQGLDKATVLQETKIFSDANTVTRHPKKCCQLITKLLHILTQGEPFTSAETTSVFFGVTKLFQSKDANLRRMMYLFIKEVAEATAADEVRAFRFAPQCPPPYAASDARVLLLWGPTGDHRDPESH